MSRKTYELDMRNGTIADKILRFALPLMAANVLQTLFNLADVIVVGKFAGDLSQAAVTSTTSMVNLMLAIFMGLSGGANVVIARALGAKEDEKVDDIVHTCILLGLVCGAVLTVVGMFCAETFLIWMGTPEEILPFSTLYMQIFFGGMIFNMVYNFSAALLRAAGDTKGPLIYLTIAGVANVLLNVMFVTVFQMNVAGVALATTISQAISAVLVVRALMKRTDACRLELKKMRFHKIQLVKMLRIGLPAGMQSSLFSISNVMIQSSINSFGDVVMSGNTAAGNIEGFVYASANAVSQSAMTFAGQNTGANRYDRVKKVLLIFYYCLRFNFFLIEKTLFFG